MHNCMYPVRKGYLIYSLCFVRRSFSAEGLYLGFVVINLLKPSGNFTYRQV
jgi:hypothetical protein